MTFGYCRISRKTQSIERQRRNILQAAPDARIYEEAYTGTRMAGRRELEKLLKAVRPGDTIYFDAVDRMARNAAEGVALYMDLYERGISLCFLKQPQINTEVYRSATKDALPMTGTDVDGILKAINDYLRLLQTRQIEAAFAGAQAEVDALHQRTREGIETARRAGKQIGGELGKKLTTKKSITAKETIRTHSRAFGGTLGDRDVMKLAGIARNTYYKYKAELAEELTSHADE